MMSTIWYKSSTMWIEGLSVFWHAPTDSTAHRKPFWLSLSLFFSVGSNFHIELLLQWCKDMCRLDTCRLVGRRRIVGRTSKSGSRWAIEMTVVWRQTYTTTYQISAKVQFGQSSHYILDNSALQLSYIFDNYRVSAVKVDTIHKYYAMYEEQMEQPRNQ